MKELGRWMLEPFSPVFFSGNEFQKPRFAVF
jgi:hypothetical protein